MKKVLLIIAGLVMVASGVAAVSAYEAHMVNVTAHVENALQLTYNNVSDDTAPIHIGMGTVFPQEWIKEHVTIALSDSFFDEDAVDNLTYELWAEWKPIPGDADPYPNCVVLLPTGSGGADESYYCWLGEGLWVGTDRGKDWPDDLYGIPTADPVTGDCPDGGPALGAVGDLGLVGPEPTNMAVLIPGVGGVLDKTNVSITMGIGLDVPVFEKFYNEHTDICPKPSHRDSPTWIILESDTDRYLPTGVDLGLDLKVQVTDIGRP